MPLMTVYDDTFNDNNVYSAAAMSVVIAAVMFVGSFSLLRLSSKRVFRGGEPDGPDMLERRVDRGAPPGRAGRARGGIDRRPAVVPTAILLLGAVYCLLPVAWVLIAVDEEQQRAVQHVHLRAGRVVVVATSAA